MSERNEIWGRWVGSQTEREFLGAIASEIGCAPGLLTDEQIDAAVADYVESMVRENGFGPAGDDNTEVENALTSLLYEERDAWPEREWEVTDSQVYLVLDADDDNVCDAKIRLARDGETWLYVDSASGYSICAIPPDISGRWTGNYRIVPARTAYGTYE